MNSSSNSWKVCGGVDAPKDEIVYCCQVFVAFVESDTCLWTGLISGALGYLLPNPSLRRNESVPFDAAVEQLDALLPSEHGGSVHDETDQHD